MGGQEDLRQKFEKLLEEYQAPSQGTWYYKLNEGNCLEFWIGSYAPRRNERQKELLEIFKERTRDYRLASYYNFRYVVCRRPAISAEDLETDFKALRELLKPIEEKLKHPAETNAVPVGICTVAVPELLKRGLNIPDYQRAYCWEKENILGLLEDISRWTAVHKTPYRIGTVVLKRRQKDESVADGNQPEFDVIDGQQRLITLALCEPDKGETMKNVFLGSSNQTVQARNAIGNAHELVKKWKEAKVEKPLDLSKVEVGVVVVGAEQSDDLAFNFFNHLNSSGVPLTDYELLKGHHLRYVKDSETAEIMARRWHALEIGEIEGRKEQELLLHKCLFRIRKWLAKEEFPANADRQRDLRVLFKEFSLGFTPFPGLCSSYRPFGIDSLLAGGVEFFDYVEFFRKSFESFAELPATQALKPLEGHSYGTLYEGILALSFLFYCKFGDIYLNEAVYAIAWNISRIRNETRIKRAYIGTRTRPEFRNIAIIISRATHEGEVLGWLLDQRDIYLKENLGATAARYWSALQKIGKELQGKDSRLEKEERDYIGKLEKRA